MKETEGYINGVILSYEEAADLVCWLTDYKETLKQYNTAGQPAPVKEALEGRIAEVEEFCSTLEGTTEATK